MPIARADPAPSTAPELVAQRFQALSDPTRIRILHLLRDGEHCVCDLQAALAIAQPLLSFHLKALRDAGFVTWRKQGRWAWYALDGATLGAAHDDVARLRAPAGRRLRVSCCE